MKKILFCFTCTLMFGVFYLESSKEIKVNTTKTISMEIKKPDEIIYVKNEGMSLGIDGTRVIKSYSKDIPDIPLYLDLENDFPDSNKNGVRDDIEIDIVEEFEDDSQLIETFFSAARSVEKDLRLIRDNLISDSEVKSSLDRLGMVNECGHLYYDDFYAKETGWSWIDMYNLHIHSKTYNTKQKREGLKKLQKYSHGFTGFVKKVTHKECDLFNQESLNFIQSK